MAFKVGQRVRVVKHYEGIVPFGRHLLGKEGVVERVDISKTYSIYVLFEPMALCAFTPGEIAPLTDPLAEKFIETVKTWGQLKEKEAA